MMKCHPPFNLKTLLIINNWQMHLSNTSPPIDHSPLLLTLFTRNVTYLSWPDISVTWMFDMKRVEANVVHNTSGHFVPHKIQVTYQGSNPNFMQMTCVANVVHPSHSQSRIVPRNSFTICSTTGGYVFTRGRGRDSLVLSRSGMGRGCTARQARPRSVRLLRSCRRIFLWIL